MKIAIISAGSESTRMLATALEKHFDTVDMLSIKEIEVRISNPLEVLINDEPISNYDCIYLKGSYKYAQLLQALAIALDGKCYLPVRAGAFINAHDKLLTQVELQKSKVPMPTTYLSGTINSARKILKRVNYPIIMKFPQGTQGKGVMFADSYASASSILDALDTLKQPFIIQEYVDTGGEDLRLIVAGEKVVAAMKRKADLGEMRANIHAGGVGEAFLPDNYAKKIAVQAAKAIGADICAVDLLEDVKGPTVIEVNISPGLQGITQAMGSDVASRIASFLVEKTKTRLEGHKSSKSKKMMQDVSLVEGQEILTSLDMRGERILLPDFANKIARIKEGEEVGISARSGEVTIRRYS